ncbi:MAG: RimK family protein [Verrucomicrobiota bacterium]|nr:RimK family protein [Verrucomicrobiota bacterium]
MSNYLFVVDNPARWSFQVPKVEVVAARKYLTDPAYSALRNVKVFNLCRSYRYQSAGYYVSLLAEARRHKPLPRIATIQDMKSLSLLRAVSGDLEEIMQKSLSHLQSDKFALSIYFSRNVSKKYDLLARHLFNLFPAPLLRAHFVRTEEGWTLQNISPIPTSEIPEDHRETVAAMAKEYFDNRINLPTRKQMRYDMAILVDKTDPTPPSDYKAIQKFQKAAESLSIATEIISKDDYGSLAEYDALFIRTTTAVNDHTYRFARRAETEGLVVIDDPESIVRCANKVFLHELMERNRIATPKTMIVHKDNAMEVLQKIGMPCILKQPDSSFSLGVKKVETVEQYKEMIEVMLDKSELIIAQEYIPTEFDWRIGIIDQKPLYACKYFMARKHWQIINFQKEGDERWGRADTIPVEMAPQRVVKMALRAANLIGNGLYGVDIKVIKNNPVLIEVNDNPSIEAGIEDDMLRDTLYERIMEVFLERMEKKREGRAD